MKCKNFHKVPLKLHFYRPQRSWTKVIFLHVSVILLTGGVSGPGGGVWSQGGVSGPGGVSNFFGGGGLQFFGGGGVCLVPGGLQFFGGVGVSNFSGWWGRVSPIFRGGLQIFFFFFFSFFFSIFKKILLGCTNSPPPPPPRRSMRGRYASYWNAFLFREYVTSKITRGVEEREGGD